jgi:hypothetical protein
MGSNDGIETPALRVKVYEHGHLVSQVLCESEDEAADVLAQWDDVDGVECVVEDLAVTHGPLDVLAPEPEDVLAEDEYREGSA